MYLRASNSRKSLIPKPELARGKGIPRRAIAAGKGHSQDSSCHLGMWWFCSRKGAEKIIQSPSAPALWFPSHAIGWLPLAEANQKPACPQVALMPCTAPGRHTAGLRVKWTWKGNRAQPALEVKAWNLVYLRVSLFKTASRVILWLVWNSGLAILVA